jgi:squalene cyclase
MTIWVLAEAARDSDKEKLADFANWTRERLKTIDQPRDTRPGWSMVSTPALYLSVMDWARPGQQAISANEVQRITGHLLRHQEMDGSWGWSSAPPQNRAPPHFESDEVATLLALLALGAHPPAEATQAKEVEQSRERALAWLAKQQRQDTTQAAGLRLLLQAQSGAPRAAIDAAIAEFLKRQHADGGWSQVRELPSDAYATGQALYFLGLAGVKHDEPAIERGAAWLVQTQQEDGSWPMTPRAHPGAKPSTNTWPIRYLGSAWGTLGLLRSTPD